LNGSELEIVNEFNHLGILFNRTGNFNKAIKKQTEKATKAMFEVLKRGRTHNLSIECQLELFNKMVKPILLYGSDPFNVNFKLVDCLPLEKTITLVLSVFAFNLQVLQYSPNLFKIFCKSSWVSASRTVSSAYNSATSFK
jgi:hypothetical protein